MTTRIASPFAVVCALVTMLALAASILLPGTAWAAVSAVYTATTNPTYENPATGVIEDAAGASNVALGESMVKGATFESALVERDVDGSTFVTLRFKLMDQISAMTFEVSGDGSSYTAATSQQMQTNIADNTADYRFQVPSEATSIRCAMDVIPMGRAVTFFVLLSDLQEGNGGSFVQTVTPGQGSDDTAVAATASPGSGGAQETVSEDASVASGASTNEGVQEFNAEGREVTGASQDADVLDGGTIALIVGGVVAAVAVVGVVVYAAYLRPKRAKQAEAAAAAARGAAGGARDASCGTRDAGRA